MILLSHRRDDKLNRLKKKNENMIFFEHHTNFEQHANVGSLGSRSKDQIY